MICLHHILKCCSLPTFLNQKMNVPDEMIHSTQIILCPLQHQLIVLQNQSVAVNDLAIVFKSLVQSGFLPFLGHNWTMTSLLDTPILCNHNHKHSRPVLIGCGCSCCYNLFPLSCLLPYFYSTPTLLPLCSPLWRDWSLLTCFWLLFPPLFLLL